MPTALEQLDKVERAAENAIRSASDSAGLSNAETEYLGRKGQLTALLRLIGTLPDSEKPAFGQAVNSAKSRLAKALGEHSQSILALEKLARLDKDRVDVTLPGSWPKTGRENVVVRQITAAKDALIDLGYEFVEAPDVEDYKYNFATLNYPPDHPAFDEQMSFYVDDEHLLRTQTTAFQGHVFERRKPPFRCATWGRCYRYEAVDATHSHTFLQMDLLAVEEGLTLSDLKGTFAHFVHKLLGPDVEVRFRPDYFPFVEPGVEMAVKWGDRWLELGGAGMVHPNILESFGIDSERYSGFAWGCGIERVAMARHGISDLRLFTENDLRFLTQF